MTTGIILMITGAAISATGFIIAFYYQLKQQLNRMKRWNYIGIAAWALVWVGVMTYLLNK